MSKKATFEPGARVYAGSDYLGTVERTVEHTDQHQDAPTTGYPDLIVRGADDGALYHIPGALVRSRRRSHGHTLVHADLGTRPRASFQSAEPTAATPDQVAAHKLRRARQEKQRSHEDAHKETHDEDTQVWRIPVWSEELAAKKRPVTSDTIHLHKGVETVEQRLNVPLEHEELRVEHLQPDQHDGHVADGPDEWIIPVYEERVVVQKQTVVAEYLRITRQRHTDTREVSDTVRREVVQLDSDASGHLGGSRPRDGAIPPDAPESQASATP